MILLIFLNAWDAIEWGWFNDGFLLNVAVVEQFQGKQQDCSDEDWTDETCAAADHHV